MNEHDDFAASLVRAGKRERMPAARRDALVASLGTGAGLVGVAGAAKVAAPAKSIASAILVKWLGVGIATTALAVGTVAGTSHYFAEEPPAPIPVVTPVPPPIVASPIAPVESIPAPPAPAPPAPTLPLRRLAPEPEPAPVTEPDPLPPPVTATHSVADEARIVERARTALAQNDIAAATRALDEHDRAYPRGAFADEARVVRIDLLARTDRAAARTEAAAFLAAHPATPYATHLRSLANE